MSAARNSDVIFSFTVPVHNEQPGLEEFYRRLKAAADALGEPYEIIFVNDGSTDETGAILRRFAAEDIRVRAVELSRNFGHQLAVTAGYDYATGRAVISLDGDSQHPPEMIGELVARWREGFEVVYTVRKPAESASGLRPWLGRLACRTIHRISGIDLANSTDFRLLDRKVIDALGGHRERTRLLAGLVRSVGFRQASVRYTPEPTAGGPDSASARESVDRAATALLSFSRLPLQLATAVGGVLIVFCVLYALIALLLWPFGAAPGGWASVTVAIVGLFGLQFLMLGILGEYVARIFDETRARPLYLLREKIGFAPDPDPAEEQADAADAEQDSDDFVVYT